MEGCLPVNNLIGGAAMSGLELFVSLCLTIAASITLWRATGNAELGLALFLALSSISVMGNAAVNEIRRSLTERHPPPK